jgi:hypothetical protein
VRRREELATSGVRWDFTFTSGGLPFKSNAAGSHFNRRTMLRSSAALLAGSAAGTLVAAEPEIKKTNLASSPSNLKITDMRYAVIVKPGPSPCVLIRVDTNQSVYGLGEIRDIAGPQYAMVLKSRILGENPLRIDYLFHYPRLSRCQPVCRVLPSLAGTTGPRAPPAQSTIPAPGEEACTQHGRDAYLGVAIPLQAHSEAARRRLRRSHLPQGAA